MIELGYRFFDAQGFIGLAAPIMRRLCQTVSESIYLNILEDWDSVVVARVEADTLLRLHLPVGTRMSAFVHSGGRMLLADRTDLELRARLASAWQEKLTGATITDADGLVAAIGDARRQGWAMANGEMAEGLCGLAVPIRGPGGPALGALSVCLVSGPRSEQDILARLIEPLRAAATTIEHLAARVAGGHPRHGSSDAR